MADQPEFTMLFNDAIDLIENEQGIGLWSWHLQTGRFKWSAGLFDIFGVTPGTLEPGMSAMRSFVAPEDLKSFTDATTASTADSASELRFKIVRRDGQLRWLRCSTRIISSDNGAATHMYGVIFDMTEKRQAFDADRRHSGLIEAIGSFFDLLVWVAKPDGSLAEPVGIPGSLKETGDWGNGAHVHPDDRYGVELAWADAVANGKRYCASFRIREKDGDYFPIISRAASITDADGKVEGWIGFSTRHLTAEDDYALEAPPPLTPAQVRAARGYLDWSANDLSIKADVSFSTVRRIETPGARNVREQSLTAIRRAFENAGIRFIANSDGSTGIIVS